MNGEYHPQVKKKTWTKQHPEPASKAEQKANDYFVTPESRETVLFWKYHIFGAFNRKSGISIFQHSIVVPQSNLEKMIYVVVYVAVNYGVCNDVEAGLYDVQTDELLMNHATGTKCIFAHISKANLLVRHDFPEEVASPVIKKS